jgi:hypothetical protein
MFSPTVRNVKFTVLAVLLCGISALAATGLAFMLRPTPPPPTPEPATPAGLFRGWPKPDLALVLSGEQHGYLLPCGCSRPQYGGLERRYNLMALLRQRGWPVAAVDVGDVPQSEGPRKMPNIQGLIKYRYAMESMDRMGYLAVGLGKYEAGLSLFNVLAEYALNNQSPRVLAANLKDRDTDFPDQVLATHVTKVEGSPLKVGIGAVIGPSAQATIKDPKVKFEDNRLAIPRLTNDLRQADLRVLLYQGSLKEAKELAADRKDFHIILCLSPADEPAFDPTWSGNTLIAAVGHKGRYVGVVGVYRTGKADRPFELRYQLVTLGEEFLTPPEQEKNHPILAKMEQYTRELKAQNHLGKYGQSKHPNQVAVPGVVPTYIGTDKCKKCHGPAYEVWETSKHSHAYATLVKATKPSLRQYDAECIVCHTVGFAYESGFKNERDTPHLKNVGCESCHGPASEHVKNPKDAQWHRILNPWKAKENETKEQKAQRQLRINDLCVQCHDVDNDVKFKLELRWPDVAH